jgi:hypothetical protein
MIRTNVTSTIDAAASAGRAVTALAAVVALVLAAPAPSRAQGAPAAAAPATASAPAATPSTAPAKTPAASAAPAATKRTAARKPAAIDPASVDPTVKTGAPAGKNTRALDRLELDTTQITGNRELPKVMVVVPWKKSDIGDLVGRPVNSLVDEALQPVDREVFRREVDYYGALSPDRPSAAPASRSETGVTPEAGSARPEK